ncbi:hypothetical protein A3H80_03015 [Candidatus Roizmanbacteria bacterium RIFCSPLOWO2_02_FULL_37_19]|uniref:Plasmid stabilization protein n=1 Tax=Candidatus Roizmanbacteria bacterium RIFCSPHIGHO2_02_FULL_37_24 TaxID=1802037 RepID=A0A1F7GZ03_9BACT|nr:MAG: hypothetical protein A2862_00220 [Candidatus Roizmanbacteria bacterium RIFCSPHIGHO2_01_FULL_38_41]OGK24015.1 MAG: hypothetical protein A3C24_02915 [Candidatus Roizmanbacteria bacterium RIFCSPHIGHO2_02_FULL_37_24]OGK32371.1 MAG: hypothetical protein A3E10_04275 [Candidatus Roizmanbacteria bacterium RIFCSPHIGHO2_12_FULL_37_23]OGK44681.1 MAG: hypothetical protein A2956_00945 [Candidatus Roizmanbacteria bacterium RIFCSPLOWO2_01_FULL_37_57]OGK53739.1 MAG: hypothetical protein A3H80_03015 [Ca
MYKVAITKKAEKQLSKLPSLYQRSIARKLLHLNFPFPKNLDVKTMTNIPQFYRLRVGQVRVIFQIKKSIKEIWIRKIKYRGGAYK